MNRETRRQQIIKSAINVIQRKGFHRTQMDDIAKEAGTAKGTIYLYFKSKQEVFTSLMEDVSKYTISVLENLEKIEEPFINKLKIFVENELVFFQKNLPLLEVIIREMEAVTQTLDTKYKKKIFKIYHQFTQKFSKFMEQGISEGYIKKYNSEFIANLFSTILNSTIFIIIKENKKIDVNKHASQIMDIFLNGMGVKK